MVAGGKDEDGEGIVKEFGLDVYTPLYLRWITNSDLLYSTGNSAQCYVAVWTEGEFGGEWIHVQQSPCAVHQNYHNIVNSLTLIQNKKV